MDFQISMCGKWSFSVLIAQLILQQTCRSASQKPEYVIQSSLSVLRNANASLSVSEARLDKDWKNREIFVNIDLVPRN